MARLAGKVGIVAGGGNGIGAATARRLAAEGASVIVGDIDRAAAGRVVAEIDKAGGRARAASFDLGDAATIPGLIEAAIAAYGGLDFLQANALYASPQDSDLLEIPLAEFDRTIEVNLRGYVLLTRAALPHLLARGGGAIVYMSSAASLIGGVQHVAYSIAKAGLNGVTRHVSARWGKDGVRANAIAPGLILTDTVKRNVPEQFHALALQRTPSTRLGTPEDIAALVAHLVSDDGAWINGQVISADGGYTAVRA
jgi:NAD(P)-dependent dehydrogenase (short-subunit alcohol dehydrogenase family)